MKAPKDRFGFFDFVLFFGGFLIGYGSTEVIFRKNILGLIYQILGLHITNTGLLGKILEKLEG